MHFKTDFFRIVLYIEKTCKRSTENSDIPPSPISSIIQFSQFSHSVVSDSLRPRGPQHARPPCPSPTPGVYQNSCPPSQWCHPAVSPSVVPFSSHLQASVISIVYLYGVVCVYAQLLRLVWLSAIPWTGACQASLTIEFSRQEYWGEVSFSPSRNLPDPRIKPASVDSPALAGRIFPTEPPEKP